jgi:hypothetical protein
VSENKKEAVRHFPDSLFFYFAKRNLFLDQSFDGDAIFRNHPDKIGSCRKTGNINFHRFAVFI